MSVRFGTDDRHSGDGVSHTVPTCEGYALPDYDRVYDETPSAVLFHYHRREGEVVIETPCVSLRHRAQIDRVKKKLCFVAFDYDTVLTSTRKVQTMIRLTYSQTENNITVGAERFRCPDVLFQPCFIGEEASGFRDTFKTSRSATLISARTVRQAVLSMARPSSKGFLRA